MKLKFNNHHEAGVSYSHSDLSVYAQQAHIKVSGDVITPSGGELSSYNLWSFGRRMPDGARFYDQLLGHAAVINHEFGDDTLNGLAQESVPMGVRTKGLEECLVDYVIGVVRDDITDFHSCLAHTDEAMALLMVKAGAIVLGEGEPNSEGHNRLAVDLTPAVLAKPDLLH